MRSLILTLALALSATILNADDYSLKSPSQVTRPWIAPEIWTTPMMDWQLNEGRIEITQGGRGHDLQLLTHQMKAGNGSFQMSVRAGALLDHSKEKSIGAVGFRFAVTGAMPDEYRSGLFGSNGVNAGLTTEGKLFIGGKFSPETLNLNLLDDVRLDIKIDCKGSNASATITAKAGNGSSAVLGEFSAKVKSDPLIGNIGLFAGPIDNQGQSNASRRAGSNGDYRFWFKDWSVSGDKIAAKPEQRFGPLLWSQYTVHDNIMKMTAHVAPVGRGENKVVILSIKEGSDWKAVRRAAIDPLSRTAHFRIEAWDSAKNADYRLSFDYATARGNVTDHWDGVIRKDPVDQKEIKLAALSCMVDYAFPNQYISESVRAQNPDLVFFAGDQIYESVAGYNVVRTPTVNEVPRAALNYLQKYWLFGWSFRDVLKDRPSVIIPDDHDVYHGNIWGNGGMAMPKIAKTTSSFGGYNMHPKWVNMVHRTQVSHLPDAYDPTPIKQGITVYHTELNVGGVSFAILADRMFKSAPGDALDEPVGGEGRIDHVNDPDFDTRKIDKPGLTLLGDRQLNFLDKWATDWKGDKLKAVLSQTPFGSVATTHGNINGRLAADLDSNGWPQSGRNRALESIRRAHALMIHGDQHVGTLTHQGVDDWNDSGWSFAPPGIANGYKRLWDPLEPGKNRQPGFPEYTGEFLDGFKNKVNVWAVNNRPDTINPNFELTDDSMITRLQGTGSGYGIIKFNTDTLETTLENWGPDKNWTPNKNRGQYLGWPHTISAEAQYGREATAHLPSIKVPGKSNQKANAQVLNEKTGKIEYTLPASGGDTLSLKVFDKKATYTVTLRDTAGEELKKLKKQRAK
ncbi:MAG: alkaline phosphatase D [Candidatus Pelagisphaera sp.]|jgi:alkaline phosphatase D